MKAVVDKDIFEQILSMIASPEGDRIRKAVAGLSEEDEFLLLCMLMETVTHVAPLEQGAAVALDGTAPDLLMRFQPGFVGSKSQHEATDHAGYRCFVEVKSTRESRFKMSGSALERLRDFADTFGFPLVFAVRFLQYQANALWVIVEDSDRTKTSITVTIEDWVGGYRPVLWNELGFVLLPGVGFEATFHSEVNEGVVLHPEYGGQIEFSVVTPQGRFSLTGIDAVIPSAFFESFGLQETKAKREGNLTHVTYVATNMGVSLADVIYCMNRLARDDDGSVVFDATQVLRKLADRQTPPLMGRSLVEVIAADFQAKGALAVTEFGHSDSRYNLWLRTGGTEPTS